MLLLLMAGAVGCSPSPYGADVTGRVTLDGKPVGPGVLYFTPADATQNPARGDIDASGAYFLKTKHERGVDPGAYTVAVQVYEIGDPPAPGERQMADPVPLVPEKYLNASTSGLSFNVESGSQTIDIALSKNE